MKTLVLIIAGVVIGTLAFSLISKDKIIPSKNTPSSSPTITTKNVDYKASFLIFTNGTKRDFNFERYFNQSDEVYIEPSSPTTVRVKKSGVTWNDFFKTLPMDLTNECLTTGTGQKFCNEESLKLLFYVNGNLTANLLQLPIKDNDRVLVHYGSLSEQEINNEIDQIPSP